VETGVELGVTTQSNKVCSWLYDRFLEGILAGRGIKYDGDADFSTKVDTRRYGPAAPCF